MCIFQLNFLLIAWLGKGGARRGNVGVNTQDKAKGTEMWKNYELFVSESWTDINDCVDLSNLNVLTSVIWMIVLTSNLNDCWHQ